MAAMEKRRGSLVKLVRLWQKDVIPEILRFLRDTRHSYERWRCAEALGLIAVEGHDELIPALVHYLTDSQPQVREKCAEALGTIASRSGDQELIQSLFSALRNEKHEYVKTAYGEALGIIGAAGQKHLVQRLKGCLLTTKDWDARRCCANALSASATAGDEELISVFVEMLSDKQAWLPGIAARTLGGFAAVGNEEAVDALLRCLRSDDDSRLRGECAKALGDIAPAGQPVVIPVLIGYLRNRKEDFFLREGCAEGLGRIGGSGRKEVFATLARFLSTKERKYMRRVCALALSTPAALASLDAWVQEKVIATLKYCSGRESLDSMQTENSEALGAWAAAGHDDVMSLLLHFLSSRYRGAAGALARVGLAGHTEVINALLVTMQGITGINDRLRTECAEALGTISAAGARVFLPTGEEPQVSVRWANDLAAGVNDIA